jgi:DNA polymerase-3 subunit delta'
MACRCHGGKNGPTRQIEVDPELAGENTPDNSLKIERRPCGKCRSCRRIASDSHPDVIQVKPKGVFIRIDEIRSLRAQLAFKSFEPGRRVVIISDAQAMNPEAGNALLKVLEEPPEETILILTTQQPSDLLATIVSRCQQIRFQPISKKGIARMLIEKRGLMPDQAATLAILAGGSLGKALAMSKGNWIEKRRWLISAIGLDHPPNTGRRPMAPLLAFAESLAKDKPNLDDSLKIIQTWLRDLSVYIHDPQRIVNQDLIEEIERIASRMDSKTLLTKIGTVETARKTLGVHSNIRMTLEVMSLQLAGLL